MNGFGAEIYNLRISRGMSQPEFAKLLSGVIGTEITRSAVSMWERGKRLPKVDAIVKIAEYFDMDVNRLLNIANTSTLQGNERDAVPVEITMIARAGKKMTQEQRDLMLKWAMLTFPEAFDK